MASGFRGFAAFVLAVSVVGLGLAAIGLTQDAPGEGNPGRWHIVDRQQRLYSTVHTVEQRPGPGHCGWETVDFLYVDGAGFTNVWGQYVRDRTGVIPISDGLGRFIERVEVPPDAWATGWGNGAQELWMSSDGSYVYLARGGVAEAWPRSDPPIACG